MHGKDMARKAIAKLQEEKSEVLSESKSNRVMSKTLVSPGLKDIEGEISGEKEMKPSELSSLSKRIADKRISAPGISREESHGLIKRIGLKHRRG